MTGSVTERLRTDDGVRRIGYRVIAPRAKILEVVARRGRDTTTLPSCAIFVYVCVCVSVIILYYKIIKYGSENWKKKLPSYLPRLSKKKGWLQRYV